MIQILAAARKVDEHLAWEDPPDAAAVDAVLTASRSLIAVATRSQQEVAGALAAFADAAGEIPGSQWPTPGPAGQAAAAGMGRL